MFKYQGGSEVRCSRFRTGVTAVPEISRTQHCCVTLSCTKAESVALAEGANECCL